MERAFPNKQGLHCSIIIVLSLWFTSCTPRSLPSTVDSSPPPSRESLPRTPSSDLSAETAAAKIENTLSPVDSDSPPAMTSPFLGQTEPVSLAIADFEVRGTGLPSDIGQSVPDRLAPRLSSLRFVLVERSRLNRIIEERDLQSAGIVDASDKPLTTASYILLGSVVGGPDVEVSARLAEVRTGKICRSIWATSGSLPDIESALDQIVGVLSASDVEYERIEADRQRHQADVLKQAQVPPLSIVRDGPAVVVKIRTPSATESEPRLYQEVRQQLRERFAKYCREELRLPRSKDWLMDYCRQRENCEDVTTEGPYKTFTFRVPLPP